jgi:hypothetical protein
MAFGEPGAPFYARGWNVAADFGCTGTALYNRWSSTEPFRQPAGVCQDDGNLVALILPVVKAWPV